MTAHETRATRLAQQGILLLRNPGRERDPMAPQGNEHIFFAIRVDACLGRLNQRLDLEGRKDRRGLRRRRFSKYRRSFAEIKEGPNFLYQTILPSGGSEGFGICWQIKPTRRQKCGRVRWPGLHGLQKSQREQRRHIAQAELPFKVRLFLYTPTTLRRQVSPENAYPRFDKSLDSQASP